MKKIILLVSLFLLLACAGCGINDGNKSADGNKSLPELNIGMMPDVDSVPFIIAQEKGFFREAGIKVNLQQFKSAVDRDAAFQSGNLDGAVSDLLAVAFAKSGGFEVKVTSYTDGCYRLVAGKGVNVNNLTALQGKDIAVSRNTIIEYVTDCIMASGQMEADSINKIVIPQIPVRLEMLQNGKIAAATLPEPMASIAVYNGCRFITGSDKLGINPGVMVFNAKSVKEKKASLQAMYKAYNKAVDYLNTADKKEYYQMIIEKSSFPAAANEALSLPKYHHAAAPEKKEVDAVMQWMQGKNLIKNRFSYDDLFVDVLPK